MKRIGWGVVALLLGSMLAMTASAQTALPSGWSDTDIGSVGVSGSGTYANGTFTVQGAGEQIYGTADQFHFVYQSWSGDGTIVARVASVASAQGNSGMGTVGVMIRETLDTGSSNVKVAEWASFAGIYFDLRSTPGGGTSEPGGVSTTLPYWVKVVRSGNIFSGYAASDGVNWVQIGSSRTVSMAQNVYVGLAVNSSSSAAATATFDNVSISSAAAPAPVITSLSATTGSIGSQVRIFGAGFGASAGGSLVTLNSVPVTVNSWSDTVIDITIPVGATSGPLLVAVAPSMNSSNYIVFSVTSQPLPSSWLDRDIGLVGVSGSGTYANGRFTVQGAGQQVWGTADQFHFVYQPWSGDGTIVARIASVASVQGNSGMGTVGVMVRETLDTGSSNVKVADWPSFTGIYFDLRSAAGGSTSEPGSVSATPPYWVKVVRSGNTFSSYAASDGVNWNQIGSSQTVTMAQNVYMGLAVNSSSSAAATATFDNVSISSVAAPAPVITSLSPASGPVGTEVTVTGSGFGTAQGTSTLTFNGQPAASVSSWSDTQVKGVVPTSAISGPVRVTVNTVDSNSTMVFTVPAPTMHDVSPAGGIAGTEVTITGSGFQDNQGLSTVTFNGVPATATSWSDTQIVTNVPASATTGLLLVTVNSVSSINSSIDFVVPAAMAISSITPPESPAGGTVTLSGSGFGAGAVDSNYQVNFAGSVWPRIPGSSSIVSWSDTSITVIVPPDATSGPVTVSHFDGASNPMPFSVEGVPTVTSVSSTDVAVGDTITVTGSGFGSSRSTSFISFFSWLQKCGFPISTVGGVSDDGSWSDSSATVTVPAGAASGTLSVNVGGVSGPGVDITVHSTVQLKDSMGNTTSYTSAMVGGQWVGTTTSGSGCSSCSVRGNVTDTYDSNGNVLTHTDELGHATTYTYDDNNNVATVSQPLDRSNTVTSSMTYNSFGEPLTVVDPLGNTTTNTYDSNGNLLTVTSPAPNGSTAASVTQFAYDPKGELTQITDPLNHKTILTYNPVGLIATVKDAQNNVTSYQYDTHGNRTSVTDALNNRTTFAYDAVDRLIKITYADQTFASFAYDVRGRRTSATDQNGKVTTYTYDDADRLTQVKDAANNVTQYAYDAENNLLSITDANSHTTSFTYDAFGRVTQTNFPSTLSESYVYDATGNLTSKTDRNGHSILYVYDALNRLTHSGYPDSTGVDYIYDLAGKIKQVTDPTGTYGFAYDNMGRLIGTTTQYSFVAGTPTFSNAYAYDANSNRTGLTLPDNSTDTYQYDSLNRLSKITDSLAGQFTFGYDGLSRRTQLTRPNGVNTVYGYDSLSRLLNVLHQTSSATLDGAIYAYDSAGNRTAKTNKLNNITEQYAYDPLYQLTQVTQGATTTESYNYDAVGNRLSSLGIASYTVDSSNQLTSTSVSSFTYDANGNTLSKTDSTGTRNYAWDFENRLASAVVPSVGTTTFRYDSFGRRIQKSGPNGTTTYLYDGDAIIAEIDASGNQTAWYAQGAGVDIPLVETRLGTASFYQQDGLGSVTSLSGLTGTLANSYTYDAFGNLAASTGSLTNPFQYTGRDFDAETGLRYYRARYYDPAIGRFISEDPIRFLGGINSYAYVRNNSVNHGDPSGLCKDAVDVCHAQLSARLGAMGGQAKVPHLWWWISIGEQDYIISGTGFHWDWVNGQTLNIRATPGTKSKTNPDDYVGNPNSKILFDTRNAHGGFASPEDCLFVRAMLERATSYPNGFVAYDLFVQNSNAAAYYVGWPYHNEVTNVDAPGWRHPLGWGVFLPGASYPDNPVKH